jgi:tRNA G37 N-methylase Trm5
MEGIQGFLQRYLQLTAPDSAVRKALSESFKELLSISIEPRKIKIVGTVAYIELDTTTKSMLFVHQEKILKRTEEKLGKKALTAIR